MRQQMAAAGAPNPQQDFMRQQMAAAAGASNPQQELMRQQQASNAAAAAAALMQASIPFK